MPSNASHADFCSFIPSIPGICTCTTSPSGDGFTFACDANIPTDGVGLNSPTGACVKLDFLPCQQPAASMGLSAHAYLTYGLENIVKKTYGPYTLANYELESGKSVKIPIPDATLPSLPEVGNLGGMYVAASLDGNIQNVTVDIALTMCLLNECPPSVPGIDSLFPIEIFQDKIDFTCACDPKSCPSSSMSVGEIVGISIGAVFGAALLCYMYQACCSDGGGTKHVSLN